MSDRHQKNRGPQPRQFPQLALGLAIILLCTGRTLRGQAQAISESSLTRINLQKFGWQPQLPIPPGERSWTSQRVVIDRKGRVLVCFPERQPGAGLSHRRDAGLSLRILRFTADGKTDLSMDLPTDNWTGYGVYLDTTDDIIARADEWLQVLIPNGEARSKQNKWKPLQPCGRTCEVRQSPSRRTLYLSDTANFRQRVAIITGKHMGDVRSCAAPQAPAMFITDTFGYYTGTEPSFGRSLRYIPFTIRWPLCDYSQASRLPISGWLIPISDDALLGGTDERYMVYGADGKVKNSFPVRLAKHETVGLVYPAQAGISENGERIAPIAFTQRGGISWLDIGAHVTAERVIVYDVTTGKLLGSIPVPRPKYYLDRAISPDGHRVAFLMNSTLTIADVP